MGLLDTLSSIGGAIAAPFTGGFSNLAGSTLGRLETTGLGALAGGLNNRSPLSSGQKVVAGSLEDQLNSIMTDPSAGTNPMRIAGRAQINSLYAGAPDQIARQMYARGFGGSGKEGKAVIQSDMARRGQMSNLESQLAEYALQRQLAAMKVAQEYLAKPVGSNVAGGAVSGGLQTLMAMMTAKDGAGGGAGGLTVNNLPLWNGSAGGLSPFQLSPGYGVDYGG
jgi:hypothetical protein